ncbi:glycosyltransferase [Pediococcus acidilactici]|uniref:glycosyltransferase n=1 Tax=Pediococcus acidilactici TaxID=1254 RepID=UPI001869C111|nr:glycosyltransferase [Pediococcus acidilactici]QOP74075.1 glycosyltransferase family 2 protein [Pediococcus acidilactici]
MENIFIILNYNSFFKVKKIVEQFIKYKNVDELVIIDNNSKETDVKALKELKNEKITVFFRKRNDGYAKGNNYGIKKAMELFGEKNIFFIVNPDIIVTNKAIEATSNFILKNKEVVGVVAPIEENEKSAWKAITPYTNLLFDGGFIGWITTKLKLNDKLRFYRKELKQNQKSIRVDVVSGAFFAFYGPTFNLAGMFDNNTFLYYEEEILSIRLSKKGFKNYILSYVSYKHTHDYSKNKNNLKTTKISNRSRKYLFQKYFQLNFFEKLLIYLANFDAIVLAKSRDIKNSLIKSENSR